MPGSLFFLQVDGARNLADEALTIDRTLDPGAAEIWKTFSSVPDIATKRRDEAAAPPRRTAAQRFWTVAGRVPPKIAPFLSKRLPNEMTERT
jgi:hypothetical protein